MEVFTETLTDFKAPSTSQKIELAVLTEAGLILRNSLIRSFLCVRVDKLFAEEDKCRFPCPFCPVVCSKPLSTTIFKQCIYILFLCIFDSNISYEYDVLNVICCIYFSLFEIILPSVFNGASFLFRFLPTSYRS